MAGPAGAELLRTVMPVAIVGVVLALRWRGMRADRRLRLGTLWILPAIYVACGVALFAWRPPSAEGWAMCAVALACGAAIGWQRGRMMRIAVDPETGLLSQRGSPAAFLLLLGLILLRQLARYEFAGAATALLVSGIGLSFGAGLLVATRAEMAIRANRLLRAA